MNPQPEEDLQRRLNKLEAEINSPLGVVPQPQEQKQTPQSVFGNLNLQLERFQIWFKSLSGAKKLVVSGVTVLVGLAMLQTVFKLVASGAIRWLETKISMKGLGGLTARV